ncbi:MAG: DUF433 domain-containing protein [Chloroflexota bacterium]
MTTAIVDIGTLIVSSPNIRNGRSRVAGTGVTVQSIVGWYKLGFTPDEIADEYGHLSLAQIHAALAYYHANQNEIEVAIQEDNEIADLLAQENMKSSF